MIDETFLSFGTEVAVFLAVLIGIYALLGKPLFAVIGALTIVLSIGREDPIPLTSIFTSMAQIADNPYLVTIPLFVFAGVLLSESGAPARLVEVDRALMGWMPGGLAIVATLACALFTAFTGASGVTIVALGGLLLPMLLREKYPERFSLGLLTAGGSLGLLFPPSLPVIVYGMVAGTDVDKLFKAGALPGLLLVFAISAYAAAVGYFREVPRHAFSLRRLGRTALYAAPELLIPVIIVGGIYSGAMAAVQAAAVTAFYVLIVEVALYRDVGIYDLPGIMRKSAELVGAIVVILGMAMGLGNYFVDAEVPQKLLEAVRSRITSPLSFLFVLNGFLLVVGCLLDIFSATLLVVPLITPLAAQYHINPFHLGIVFLTNLEIGYLTPPVGMNLFLASLRFRRPALEIAWNALPFLLILLGCLAIITYVPWLSSS